MSYLILSRNTLMRALLSSSMSSNSAAVVRPYRLDQYYQQNANSMLLVARYSLLTGSNVTHRQTPSPPILHTGLYHGYINIFVQRLHAIGSVIVSAPPLPEAIHDGTIRLLKKVGDRVSMDETIAQIETDQIDLEVHAPESGTIESLLVADGDTVKHETKIARIILNGRNSGATIS